MKEHLNAADPFEQELGWQTKWLTDTPDADELKALPAVGEGMVRVRMVASAIGEDSTGDKMMESAIDDIVRDAKKGLTSTMDHSMKMADVVGKTVWAQKRDGQAIVTMDLDSDHPGTATVLNHIAKGIPSGPSIRFRIPRDGAKLLKDSYALEIHRVQTHSIDLVAIPAVWQARGSMDRVKSYLASQSPAPLPEEATMELTAENLKAIAEAVAPLLDPLQKAVADLSAEVTALKAVTPEPTPVVEAAPATPEEAFKTLPEAEQTILLEYRQKSAQGLNLKTVYEAPVGDVDAQFSLSTDERAVFEKRLLGTEVR